MIRRGDLWWTDFREVQGSRLAQLRPAVVIQSDRFNTSRIQRVMVVVVTSNLALADLPGNVLLEPEQSGLTQLSVVNATQVATVNKVDLLERIHVLSTDSMARVESGLRLVQGLD